MLLGLTEWHHVGQFSNRSDRGYSRRRKPNLLAVSSAFERCHVVGHLITRPKWPLWIADASSRGVNHSRSVEQIHERYRLLLGVRLLLQHIKRGVQRKAHDPFRAEDNRPKDGSQQFGPARVVKRLI